MKKILSYWRLLEICGILSAKSRQSLDKRIRILKTLMHSNELLRPLQYRYLMKIDPLFKDCLADVAPEIRSEVRLNMDIANRIYDILQEKNMTQREFAALMGKCESEISRWLTGSHGFTTTSIAKISAVLNEPIVEVKHKPDVKYVFVPINTYIIPSEFSDGNYTDRKTNSCVISYSN
ncbi:MAG: helix-turn-helix domain-containing protein [Anaerovoracaceae bacterium]